VKNKASKTIEETYKKLTLREQILLRPDTYIGSVEPTETYMWVAAWDDTQAKPVIEKKPVKYVPGYIKIFDEVITNASDHKHRGGRVKNIRVYCGKTDESGDYKIKITNDGTGIPVTVHAVEKCYVPELIFGHLLTGSNYDDTEDRFGGGRNGFGTKLTNIFSKHFTVRTDDGKSVFNGSWKDNMSSLPHTDIQESKKGSQTGTEIEFTPDFDKLSMTADMLSDAESIMLKRTLDIAARRQRVFQRQTAACRQL
jgi:DNA topoisomerase II